MIKSAMQLRVSVPSSALKLILMSMSLGLVVLDVIVSVYGTYGRLTTLQYLVPTAIYSVIFLILSIGLITVSVRMQRTLQKIIGDGSAIVSPSSHDIKITSTPQKIDDAKKGDSGSTTRNAKPPEEHRKGASPPALTRKAGSTSSEVRRTSTARIPHGAATATLKLAIKIKNH